MSKKILTLSIKQQYFDEIMAGTKTHEYRDIKPTNGSKYVYLEYEGKVYPPNTKDIPEDDETAELKCVHYDAIKFLTGAYSGKRPWALVEVKDANVVILTDDNGDDILYEYNGDIFYAAIIDYTLGRVIDKSNY